MKLNEHNPLSRVGVSYHHVTQKPHLRTQVKECDAMLQGIVSHLIAYLVVQVIHKPAFVYG